jgi:hypothetical protein
MGHAVPRLVPRPLSPTYVEVSHGRGGTVTVVSVVVRVVIAAVLFAVLAALAWWLERRRRDDAPTQAPSAAPSQLDRADFPRPDASWLVVLFTSSNCDSCAGLFDKAAALESNEVAVTEVEYFAQPKVHERYGVDAAPLTLVADADGVVRASFLGAFSSPELWNAVAELRAG